MKFYTNVSTLGNLVCYRGVEDGRKVFRIVKYSPTLFLPTNDNTPLSWKSIRGTPLEPKIFPTIINFYEYIKKYKDVEGFELHGNIQPEYQYISDEHLEDSIEWNVSDITIAYLDIEVGSEFGMPNIDKCENPITAITIKFSNLSHYDVFGCGEYTEHRNDVRYHHCSSEKDLIERFLRVWKENYPDVVTGWNIKTFDIPYIIGRICTLDGVPAIEETISTTCASILSPWKQIGIKAENFYGKPQRVYKIFGVSILDYLQLFRKYASNASQESYKLDHIAHVELKEQKLDFSEYDNLHDLYRKNYQKFIEYNIKDVELVERLNGKGRLIDLALTLAYDNKTNYEDVFSQVRMWDVICYNYLRKKQIAVPPKIKQEKQKAYTGAYVKEPKIGKHRYVASFDLDSLYPHLMMQYNLSPETLIEEGEYSPYMKKLIDDGVSVEKLLDRGVDLSSLEGCTITPNGQFFRTDKQGFLAEIMEFMYTTRTTYKKKQITSQKEYESITDATKKAELEYLVSRYKNLQLAKKVQLNSAYGAMGNEHFRFFDVRVAEGVTLAGQLSIRWIERKLNLFMNKLLKTKDVDYVLASDTDSIYLNMEPLVRSVFGNPDTIPAPKIIDWMDKSCLKIKEFIDISYKELAEYVHAHKQKMSMKRESLVDVAIWTAKKRYVLSVWDEEGVRYKEPKIKIQGLEAIKSSTPSACRDKIKQALKIILCGSEGELIDYIEEFRKEFHRLPLSEIAFPRSVNGIEKYGDDTTIYSQGTPMHVKAALFYNKSIIDRGLDKTYDLIHSGEKIKFIHLKEPNLLGTPIIAFMNRIPKELDIERMVDYRTQFQKSFIDPLSIILDSIGWKSERVATLEKFFG